VWKREVPEELLLLLYRVDKEGAGAMIPYVYPKLPLVFRRPSSSCAFSGSLAIDFKTLYPQQLLRSPRRQN